MAYKGVFVSLKPRKTPCIAKERRTAGAPRDLNVKYCCAGFSIGESWIKKNKNSSGYYYSTSHIAIRPRTNYLGGVWNIDFKSGLPVGKNDGENKETNLANSRSKLSRREGFRTYRFNSHEV